VALERAIGVERGPAATAHVVALAGASPRELGARPAITICVAAVEFSRHRDEAQFAETVLIELDEAGLDQIGGLLIPVVHLGDAPPACDARTPGHAARAAAGGLPPQRHGNTAQEHIDVQLTELSVQVGEVRDKLDRMQRNPDDAEWHRWPRPPQATS